jgi:hypothetical protein
METQKLAILQWVIGRCLERTRSERPASAEAVIEALQSTTDELMQIRAEPPAAPSWIVQVTAVLFVPVTVTVNGCAAPRSTVAVAGPIRTTTAD